MFSLVVKVIGGVIREGNKLLKVPTARKAREIIQRSLNKRKTKFKIKIWKLKVINLYLYTV